MDRFNLRYLKPSVFQALSGGLIITLFLANKYIFSHWGISLSIFALSAGTFSIVNRYLWNVKPFSWLFTVPDFSGRYEGLLHFEYRNENNEIVKNDLEHIKVIRQNGSEIVIKSWTK